MEMDRNSSTEAEPEYWGSGGVGPACNQTTTEENNGTNSSCGIDSEYGDYSLGEEYPNPFNIFHIRVIFIIVYSLVFACCFIGNLLVILVVLKHRRMRTITNFFLANLAVADLCVGIFCVLPNLSTQLSPEWILGQVMCKLYFFVQAMSYTGSITILTVISIERYFAIIYPIRSKQLTTMNLLRVTVIVVWVISAGSGVPFLIIYDTAEIGPSHYCLPMYDVNLKALVTTNFVLWYLLPLVLMTVMYTRISIVLWESSRGDHSKKVGGFGGKLSITGTLKKRFLPTKNNPAVKEQRLVAADSEDTSSATEGGRHGQGRKATLGGGRCVGSANEQQKLMDCADYSSQCESSNPVVTSGPETEKESLDDSLSEEEIDYEDDWPSNKPRSNHIKLTKVSKNRKGSPKFPFKTNGLQKGKGSGNERAADKSKPLVKCSSTCGSRYKAKKQDNKALLARRRVIRLLVAVIVSFAVCVLPYHIRLLWQAWGHLEITFNNLLIPPITFVIYYMNSGLNPMLYAFLSDRFRGSLVEVLTCKDKQKSRQTQMSFTTKTMNSTVQY